MVTVGGGISGAAFAKAIAERGAKILVLERETRFKDRIRGEMMAPWGVAEARELGILNLLKEACAHEVPFVEMGMGPRNLAVTTQQRSPALTFAHQEMQEAIIGAAEAAVPDHLFSGPDLPVNEQVRARLFGEC